MSAPISADWSPAMVWPDGASEIRRQMAEIRCCLQRDADRVADNARRSTDWRTYVVRSPWTWAAVAAVVGYMLVPRSAPKAVVDGKAVADVVKDAAREGAADAAEQSRPSAVRYAIDLMMMPIVQSVAAKGALLLWDYFVERGKESDAAPTRPKRPR